MLAETSVVRTRAAAVGARQPAFFPVMSGLLLIIVFFGFAPTYYRRPPDAGALPGYLHVHGALLTAWFSLLVVQSWLVATRRRVLHTQLGLAGATLAGVIVVFTPFVVVRAIPKFIESGQPMQLTSLIVLADLLALVAFAIMLAVAVRRRREPAMHSRMMLLASILIASPALGRLSLYSTGTPIPGLVVHMLLPFLLVAHDLIVSKRVHPATTWGTAAILGTLVFGIAMSNTAFGQNLVRSLG